MLGASFLLSRERGFFARLFEELGHFIGDHVEAGYFVPVLFDCRVNFQGPVQGVAVDGHHGFLQALGQFVDLVGDGGQVYNAPIG